MPEYKFIAVQGGDGKPWPVTRSTRSHAIRAGLRKGSGPPRTRTAVRTTRGQANPTGTPSAEPATTSKYRTASGPSVPRVPADLEISAELSEYRLDMSLGAGRVDPFNSLPVPTNLEVDCLVKYFMIKFGHNLATLDRQRSWFPYALQSPPMMHSTLAMTAVMWRAEYPALEYSVQLEGLRQKGDAMREIRTRLEYTTDPVVVHDGDADDDEIAFLMSTMSTLAIVEVYESDFEAAGAHLQGVKTLFGSGRGRNRFTDDFILCKSINVADIQVAVARGHQHIFPLFQSHEIPLPQSILEDAQYPPLHSSIANTNEPYAHGQIFVQIRRLLLARHSLTVSSEALRTLLNTVDHSILRHLYQDCIDASDASRRSRALVLAAHVFVYVTLHQVPCTCPLVRRLCARLQSTVGSILVEREIWAEHKAALLWIVFVGLLGTGESTEPCPVWQWFLGLFRSTIRECAHDFSLENGGIRGVLSTFLWNELFCQPLLVRLEETTPGLANPV